MTHSTLAEMESIEQEAYQIQESYRQQIQDSQQQIATRLEEARANFESETQQLVEQARQYYNEQQLAAKERLATNVARHQQQLEQALSSQKADLISQIIERVVEQYGN